MLVNFRFKNFRSFFNENIFSLEATSNTELEKINTFEVSKQLRNKGENVLLKSAVIFGGNASGKSNVLKALSYMRNVIIMSGGSQYPIIQMNEPFAFYKDGEKTSSEYEVEFIQNNVFYKYGFEIKEGIVIKEWLFQRKEKLSNVFKREMNNLSITGLSSQAVKLINISGNTLFISIGRNFNLDIGKSLSDVMEWFQNLLIVFENNANSLDIYSYENGKYRKKALEILKKADIGINEINVKKDEVAGMADFNDFMRFNTQLQTNPMVMGQQLQEDSTLYNIDMVTTFDVFDFDNNKVDEKDVLLFKNRGFNSEGTSRLLFYLGWALVALDKGRVLLVDDIDSKLSYLFTDYLIGLFNSIDNNPKNSQLICTTHNTLLMDDDLRRDQIYFTNKDNIGVSSLASLSDFKNVRKTDLFSKKYLAGFYSKLPNMNDK